jgi:RimJ/RimL family protein N-acetyltransferase
MRLVGDNISLRPMRPEEVELIHSWVNLPEILPFWYGRVKSLPEVKADYTTDYFTDDDPYTGRCFAIETVDIPIGMICYNRIDRDNRNVDIDMLIGDKKYWNLGLGSDALKTFIRYLFTHFGLNRIWLGSYVYNERALRTYEKAGFMREGVLREDAYIEGKFVDTIVLSILRREFESTQKC